MSFDEVARKRIESVVAAYVQKRRPPLQIRPQLDIGFRIAGHSVEIFEIRPSFHRPTELREGPVAKATFVKSRELWKVLWHRSDMKWHSYAPVPTVGSIEKFLELVEADPHGCFWG